MTVGLTYRLVDELGSGTVLQFMQQLYEQDGYPFEIERARAALLGIVNDLSLGRIWLVLEREEAIGYVVLTFGYSLESGGRDATLDELFIVPSHRGRGVGTQVVGFVAEACQDLGVRTLFLEVERDNVAARALYKKAGFETVERCLMRKQIL